MQRSVALKPSLISIENKTRHDQGAIRLTREQRSKRSKRNWPERPCVYKTLT